MGVKWDGRERLVWAVAVYKERLGCMTVCSMWGLGWCPGWARRTVGRVRGSYWMSWSARIRG
jgi:hypothetical protein